MNTPDLFANSALTENNPFISTADVLKWMKERNQAVSVNLSRIPFDALNKWLFDRKRGIIHHSSGKFFTVEGIHVKTNWGNTPEWEQPIINQPEIGYLGLISKEIQGVLYFLLQAKIEPGNVNSVQLSPTLQATRSNYSQIHKGKKPRYLEYFQNASNDQILLDQLQSEQGARFLKKRNRNIIIKIEEDIPVHEDFVWLTLGQIKKLILTDNLVNMDTRTVISGIPLGDLNLREFLTDNINSASASQLDHDMLRSATHNSSALHSFDDIIKWMTDLKCRYDLEINPVSVFNLDSWEVTSDEIRHRERMYFRVIAAKVEIGNREVETWTQPLVEPMQDGLIAFLYKKINGVNHFLVQAKLECGNFDILEMAPTVQCLTGPYVGSTNLPFLDYVLNAKQNQIKYDTLQSEEGGRFYREQNRNLIIETGEDFQEKLPRNYLWMTLKQLGTFLKFNNYLNIQTRSLISAINFIKPQDG
ncbi:NDP-hexose 2,3-dehydratase [bacterium I07]|nr:NDP-hexose 2,3-dehydratase [bacterium I07]